MAEENNYYAYTPSLAAAATTITAFTILLAIHLFLLFKRQTWFCIPFVIGGILETVGYIARAIGHSQPTSLPPYIMQALLLLLAPIFFAASVYMFLGRIMLATSRESASLIRVTWLTKLFVGGDVLCFLLQAAGGGILASSDDGKAGSDMGKIVILVGLNLQMVIFGFFVFVAGVFQWRVRRDNTAASSLSSSMKSTNVQCCSSSSGWECDWQRYMYTLYTISVIITVRNLFRVIEYAMGNDGYLMVKEWPIYVFDALPMAVVMALSCLWYVGQIVPSKVVGNGEDVEMLGNERVVMP